jgi:hypothetical protein
MAAVYESVPKATAISLQQQQQQQQQQQRTADTPPQQQQQQQHKGVESSAPKILSQTLLPFTGTDEAGTSAAAAAAAPRPQQRQQQPDTRPLPRGQQQQQQQQQHHHQQQRMQSHQALAARRMAVAAAKKQQQQLYVENRQAHAMPAHLQLRTDQPLHLKPILQVQMGFPGCSRVSAAQIAQFQGYVEAVMQQAGESLCYGDPGFDFWHRTEERQPAGKTAVAFMGCSLLVDETQLQQLIDPATGTVPVPGSPGVRLAATYNQLKVRAFSLSNVRGADVGQLKALLKSQGLQVLAAAYAQHGQQVCKNMICFAAAVSERPATFTTVYAADGVFGGMHMSELPAQPMSRQELLTSAQD